MFECHLPTLSPWGLLRYNQHLSPCGMEALEKLELIVKGELAEKKRKLGNSKQASNFYVSGLEHEISALEVVMIAIDKIKHNHFSVSDERITKMYGSPAK